MKSSSLFFLFASIVFTLSVSGQQTMLYGMTDYGGGRDSGAIIAFDPVTHSEGVVWSFSGSPSDGMLPGTALTLDPHNNLLYAMTLSGGSNTSGGYSKGTVFSFDPAHNSERIVHDFEDSPVDGALPLGDLVYDSASGFLYGMTQGGGANGVGSIISIDPSSGTVSILYSFVNNNADGVTPWGHLVSGPSGTDLYGLTRGGANGKGAIISFNSQTQTESVLYSFRTGADGENPMGSLVYDPADSLFYGMTQTGGIDSMGVIFSFDPISHAEHVVWTFGMDSDGGWPYRDLVYHPQDGLLYGTTGIRGVFGGGTIFSFDPSTGTERVLWDFKRTVHDGANPQGNLVYLAGTGLFYGMTAEGGTNDSVFSTHSDTTYTSPFGQGFGTIFTFDPVTHAENVVWNFGGPGDGWTGAGSLVLYTGTIDGLSTIPSDPMISVSPNPATAAISVLGLSYGQQINVYDGLSEKVWASVAEGAAQNIDLSQLSAGVYVITVMNTDGNILCRKKIIKEN